eukprot:TRINITY_DN347069_c0_g1_i1.p1 TRINITY_DN347069_c0_g1~~TRINITY_DN347069_c0_g1_i1.p1  ORF type:complete len:675 (-),score=182.60 TRINITY_DN347069_c0_g1_i1:213-2237(-)
MESVLKKRRVDEIDIFTRTARPTRTDSIRNDIQSFEMAQSLSDKEFQMRRLQSQNDAMKRKVEFLVQEEARNAERSNQKEKEFLDEKYKFIQRIQQLELQVTKSANGLSTGNENSNAQKEMLQSQLKQRDLIAEQLRNQNETMIEEVAMLKRKYRSLKKSANSKSSSPPIKNDSICSPEKEKALRKQVSELTSQVCESQRKLRDVTRQAKDLSRKMHNQEALEAKNSRLQSQVKDLEKSINDLNQRKCDEGLEAKIIELEATENEWKKLLKMIFGNQHVTPTTVIRKLNELQKENLKFRQEVHNLRQQILSSRTKASQHKLKSSTNDAVWEQRISALQDALSEAKRQQNKAERDNQQLQSLLNTFNTEFHHKRDECLEKRVDELQRMLTESQGEVTRLRNEGNDKNMRHSFEIQVNDLEQKLASKIGQINSLELEIDNLRKSSQINNLSSPNGRRMASNKDNDNNIINSNNNEGMQMTDEELANLPQSKAEKFDPSTMKIIHFKQNPQEDSRNKLIASLKTRVAELESKLESSVPTSEAPSSAFKTPAPTSRTESKRCQRLMECFTSQMKDLREAVYQLTGYRITMTSNREYMLHNMYTTSSDDHFAFRRGTSGQLELLESEFFKSLDPSLMACLERFKSIPGFLASVTLSLLENVTLGAPEISNDMLEQLIGD